MSFWESSVGAPGCMHNDQFIICRCLMKYDGKSIGDYLSGSDYAEFLGHLGGAY